MSYLDLIHVGRMLENLEEDGTYGSGRFDGCGVAGWSTIRGTGKLHV